MVFDSLRAVDYLCTRPDIDASRIGTLGMSMGSTLAWWLAALDVRIRVCVDICCLTDFEALIDKTLMAGKFADNVYSVRAYIPNELINEAVKLIKGFSQHMGAGPAPQPESQPASQPSLQEF